jgi:hypothetical protein
MGGALIPRAMQFEHLHELQSACACRLHSVASLLISVPLRRPRNHHAFCVAAFGPPAWQMPAWHRSSIYRPPRRGTEVGRAKHWIAPLLYLPAARNHSVLELVRVATGRHGAPQPPAPSRLQLLQPCAAPLKIQQSTAAGVCDEECSLDGLAIELS